MNYLIIILLATIAIGVFLITETGRKILKNFFNYLSVSLLVLLGIGIVMFFNAYLINKISIYSSKSNLFIAIMLLLDCAIGISLLRFSHKYLIKKYNMNEKNSSILLTIGTFIIVILIGIFISLIGLIN